MFKKYSICHKTQIFIFIYDQTLQTMKFWIDKICRLVLQYPWSSLKQPAHCYYNHDKQPSFIQNQYNLSEKIIFCFKNYKQPLVAKPQHTEWKVRVINFVKTWKPESKVIICIIYLLHMHYKKKCKQLFFWTHHQVFQELWIP